MSRRFSAAVTAVLLCPFAAMAAEGKGMPQLDFANPLTKAQVIWGALIFLALYLLLSRWALPQVASVLEAREARINADLETARGAKTRADAAVNELIETTAKARAEAQAAINAAVEQAKQAAAAQAVVANARLERQLQAAEANIAAARGTAMAALQQVARDTADTVITRLTGVPADAATLDRAVAAALAARAAG
jgi:F-type H+-transporting ATPase subunit b